MRESVLRLGEDESLVGVVTAPALPDDHRGLPGVVLLNAGIVHRVGPHRLYVKLARRLAAAGHVVLRFDLSGVGDSPVRDDDLPFERSAVAETRLAMGRLSQTHGVRRFVLMGICSGAWASFKIALCEDRVVGAVLVNAGGHLHDRANRTFNESVKERVMARHYWRLALRSRFSLKSLRKALAGRVDVRGVARVMAAACVAIPSRFVRGGGDDRLEAEATLRRAAARGARLLHVYAEGDPGRDYIREILGRRFAAVAKGAGSDLEVIAGADHTFTLLWAQERLIATITTWLADMDPSHQAPILD